MQIDEIRGRCLSGIDGDRDDPVITRGLYVKAHTGIFGTSSLSWLRRTGDESVGADGGGIGVIGSFSQRAPAELSALMQGRLVISGTRQRRVLRISDVALRQVW
jgi:hypothetical protein